MTRIAVTTAADAADRLVRSLEAAGLDPVLLPCITITPAVPEALAAVRQAAAGADWLVVTSHRAISTLWPDGGMPSGPAVAAVGSATASAAAAAGGRLGLVGDGGAAALQALLAPVIGGTRVVFPHAAGADPETMRFLRERAGDLLGAAVYYTTPIPPEDDPVDGVVFASPSAVDGWMLSRSLSDLQVAAIGPTTAAHLEAVGCVPAVVATHPDPDAVASALASSIFVRRQEAR